MMRTGVATLALAGAIGIALGAVGTRALAGDAPGGTVDRAATEKIIHDYLLAHPEVLSQAAERLGQRQQADAIAPLRQALEKPFAGAWAGSAHPEVTLVMFTDYSCGYCRASVADVDRLLKEEPGLRVVWREIPVLGPQSQVAARDALAIARGGRYPAFHRGLFAAGRPDEATLAKVARSVGVDPSAMTAAANGADVEREIASNLSLAGRLGVNGTPSFVIGNQMLGGAVGYEALKKAVHEARSG